MLLGLFHPTHAIEHLTHSNNLKVAAIARDVDFLEGECVHQHGLNFMIFHGLKFI